MVNGLHNETARRRRRCRSRHRRRQVCMSARDTAHSGRLPSVWALAPRLSATPHRTSQRSLRCALHAALFGVCGAPSPVPCAKPRTHRLVRAAPPRLRHAPNHARSRALHARTHRLVRAVHPRLRLRQAVRAAVRFLCTHAPIGINVCPVRPRTRHRPCRALSHALCAHTHTA